MLLGLTVLVALFLDGWLLSERLVKMEIANAAQLELHAMARHGRIVLAENPAYYADALHHWVFHLAFLVTPHLVPVAAVLNGLWYLAALVLYRGVAQRMGTVPARLATLFFVAAPVAPILSKHVISTAFVPLVMTLFVFALLDVGAGQGQKALGRACAWFGVLLALNHGHLVYLLPLVWVAWRARTRPPLWGLLAFAAASTTGILELILLGPPNLDALWEPHYDTLWQSMQRLIHIENGIEGLVPVAYGLYGVAWSALGICAWKRTDLPAGLGALLLMPPTLYYASAEAVISWQIPLFLAIAFAGSRVPRVAWVYGAYALVFSLAITSTMVRMAALPNVHFFSMSSTGLREDMMAVLVDELDIHADEFEQIRLEHTWMEDDLTSTQPGLAYLRDEITVTLPPGGDRCVLIDDKGRPPPEGATDLQRVEAHTLVFQAWRGTPCEPNVRVPHAPIAWLDLHDGSVHVGIPPIGPVPTP